MTILISFLLNFSKKKIFSFFFLFQFYSPHSHPYSLYSHPESPDSQLDSPHSHLYSSQSYHDTRILTPIPHIPTQTHYILTPIPRIPTNLPRIPTLFRTFFRSPHFLPDSLHSRPHSPYSPYSIPVIPIPASTDSPESTVNPLATNISNILKPSALHDGKIGN